jgi:hypothetical protein
MISTNTYPDKGTIPNQNTGVKIRIEIFRTIDIQTITAIENLTPANLILMNLKLKNLFLLIC